MKQIFPPNIFRRFRRMCSRFGSDRNGNVMVIFGFFAIPMFMFAGAALDYTRSLDAKTQMQSVADLASLAATKELLQNDLTLAQAEALAVEIFNSQITSNQRSFGTLNKIKPTAVATKGKVDGVTTAKVTLSATAEIDLVLASIGGDLKLYDIGVSSASQTSAEALGAISMFFVLDRSGSMGWSGKMESLKKASDNLLTQLAASDPDKKYVRTGAVGYNTGIGVHQKLNWGTTHTNTFIKNLYADGGTNTSVAAKKALVELKKKKETTEHDKKNGQKPSKFMLLMTDGANNKKNWDTKTLKYCKQAKEAGIEVYAVAFLAPSVGEKLLKDCASSAGHYFDADKSAELVAAFKEIGAQVSESIPRVTR